MGTPAYWRLNLGKQETVLERKPLDSPCMTMV